MNVYNRNNILKDNFDPAYFRETRPGWQGLDDEACYEAWINDPSIAGPGCGKEHLASLRLQLDNYPSAFPWQLYVRLQPAAGANRWTALDHFCRQGFKASIRLPFDHGAKGFLVSLARSYAGVDDFWAIRAFETAAILAPLSDDELQHLGDSYLRLGILQRAREVYLSLLRSGGGTDWTLRNCIRSSMFLSDWDAAAEVLFETKSAFENTDAWTLAAFEVVEDRFAWNLQRAQGKYAAGDMQTGDDDIAAAVAASSELLERLGLVVDVDRGSKHVLVIANCDDAVSYSQRAEPKSALFAQLSMPWRLMPMTELENAFDALSGAFGLIFFNVPATLLPLRVLLAARRAQIPVMYEADSAIFDPAVYPPPLPAFDGLLTPELHDEMRVASVLRRELARRCDVGLGVSSITVSKLEDVVINGKASGLAKVFNPDPFIFPNSTPLPGRFIFLRAPRFLAVVGRPGTLGAALLEVMREHPDLGLVTSGYVHLDTRFNVYDSRLVELGPSDEPSTYRSVIAAATLTVAPPCMEDDDGMSELIWLEAAQLGAPTLLDGHIADALGLKAGETCVTVGGEGWSYALEQALSDLPGLDHIGRRARDHAQSTRSVGVVAAQLMAALRCAGNDEVFL